MKASLREELTKLAWFELVAPGIDGATKRLAEKVVRKTVKATVLPGSTGSVNGGTPAGSVTPTPIVGTGNVTPPTSTANQPTNGMGASSTSSNVNSVSPNINQPQFDSAIEDYMRRHALPKPNDIGTTLERGNAYVS